jgi:hypothetical protein
MKNDRNYYSFVLNSGMIIISIRKNRHKLMLQKNIMNKNSKRKEPIKEHVISTKEYALTLADLKGQIKEAQVKAVLSANKEMLKLYWLIGKTVAEKQEK